MSLALATPPASRDESWRYAPTGAATLAPTHREAIAIPTGAARALTIIAEGDANAIQHWALDLAPDARCDLTLVNIAGVTEVAEAYARIAITARLAARARLTIGAVQIAGGASKVEIVTTITHAEPDATSRQVVRSIVGDAAEASYIGRLCVAPGADGSDGGQSVRALLLSPTARANAQPELEILADDVACAHGCAIGALDESALFYLAQRGLTPAGARLLLLGGFVAEALPTAPPELAGRLAARLRALIEGQP